VRRVLVSLAALSLLACGDFRFDTEAAYRAPIGRFDVVIHATGLIHAGDDLASESVADVRITPLPGARGEPVEIHTAVPPPADPPDVAAVILRSGYEAPRAELDEVNRVVDLAMRGSKATLVQGQTRALEVVSVRFRYP